ncbi:hypothetical protein CF319_g7484 [Tilletia indica]|nr:hypothetical protein CF319_g7484 [Tilletia indica]
MGFKGEWCTNPAGARPCTDDRDPLAELPTEILVIILADVVAEAASPTAHGPDVPPLIDVLHSFAAISRKARLAVGHYLAFRFRIFRVPEQHIHHTSQTAWLPFLPSRWGQEFHPYFLSHLGAEWDQLPSIQLQTLWFDRVRSLPTREIQVDVRVKDFAGPGSARVWNRQHAPQWIRSSALLTRISICTTTLERIHVRMGCQTEQFRIVEHILSANPSLKDVIIEADCALSPTSFPRAVFNLDNITRTAAGSYQDLDRFVIRAPGIELVMSNSAALFQRLGTCAEFRIAVFKLRSPLPAWQLVHSLMLAAPGLTGLEVAYPFEQGSNGLDASNLGTARVVQLVDLTLDLPEVDSRLLNLLDAPNLRFLRVRTMAPFNGHGSCPPSHFPGLEFVNVWCSCPVGVRFRTLGIPREHYASNLTRSANHRDHFPHPFPAVMHRSDVDTSETGLGPLHVSQATTETTNTSLRVMPIFMTELASFSQIAELFSDDTPSCNGGIGTGLSKFVRSGKRSR